MKMDLKEKIRVINGFPKGGISFKDIATLLGGKDACRYVIDLVVDGLKDKGITAIVVSGARGFLFGSAVTCALRVRFIPVKKPGKLPGEVSRYSHDLEYGTDKLEVRRDVIKKGDKIVIVDDLSATGGTVNAIAKLVEKNGGEIITMKFLIELTELDGRDINKNYHTDTLVQYES